PKAASPVSRGASTAKTQPPARQLGHSGVSTFDRIEQKALASFRPGRQKPGVVKVTRDFSALRRDLRTGNDSGALRTVNTIANTLKLPLQNVGTTGLSGLRSLGGALNGSGAATLKQNRLLGEAMKAAVRLCSAPVQDPDPSIGRSLPRF